MAKLDNYTGSVELISGIKQKNNGDFPLMEAHSIQVDESGKRLDEALEDLEFMGIDDDGNGNIKFDSPSGSGTGGSGTGTGSEETDPTVPSWAKQPNKPTYTASEVGADPSGTAASKVSEHNTSDTAHNDIRTLIAGLTSRLNALADSDDTTLDQLSEIVAYIKNNKSLIDSITTSKVSVSDIVDNLTSSDTNKPLSAKQGAALKTLVDAITIPEKLPNPNALSITVNGTTETYDGSEVVTINIPSGSTGGSNVSDFFVTPEQFGAVGDGVADDTVAVRNALNCGISDVRLENKYLITEQIEIVGSKKITGRGTLYGKSANGTYTLLRFWNEDNGVKAEEVIINGISFVAKRDNTNVYPPKDHTRPSGSLSSNVIFIYTRNVRSVKISNVKFEGSEFDFTPYFCDMVKLDTFTSENASMVMYAQGNKHLLIQNGISTLYDKVGIGDHQYYIGAGNTNVFLSKLKMISTTKDSGSYPLHFYTTSEQIAEYGDIENVTVEYCYIESDTLLASSCSGKILLKNIDFKGITDTTSLVYSDNIGKIMFDKCRFSSGNILELTSMVLNGELFFYDCDFNNPFKLSGINSVNMNFKNCNFVGVRNSTGNFVAKFIDCMIKSSEYYAFYSSNDNANFSFYGCVLLANADGVFSIRSSETISFIQCYFDNEESSKYLNYNTSEYNPTINIYGCCFPTLNKRTSDTGTIWNEGGNISKQ